MLSRTLTGLIIACLGAIVVFGFFALLGLFDPGDVIWLTIAMAVLAAAVLVHSMLVRHDLHRHGNRDLFRTMNRLRERRGF
jgi:heme exporter protein D